MCRARQASRAGDLCRARQASRAGDLCRARQASRAGDLLHLLKLAVGIDGVDHLRAVQAARLARTGRLIHVTRYRPRRAEEILAGGSMYWVVRHRIRVRQRIVGLDRHETAAGGKPKCAIVLDPALIATDPVHRRPHQGWRYLDAANAPRDLGPVGTVALPEDAFPPEMAAELRALGLL